MLWLWKTLTNQAKHPVDPRFGAWFHALSCNLFCQVSQPQEATWRLLIGCYEIRYCFLKSYQGVTPGRGFAERSGFCYGEQASCRVEVLSRGRTYTIGHLFVMTVQFLGPHLYDRSLSCQFESGPHLYDGSSLCHDYSFFPFYLILVTGWSKLSKSLLMSDSMMARSSLCISNSFLFPFLITQ